MMKKKKILIYKRKYKHNYGDLVLADCCRYLLYQAADICKTPIRVSVANVYEKFDFLIRLWLKNKDAVVYPGGGLNSAVFNEMLLHIFTFIEQREQIAVYFNAVGISRVKPKKKNIVLLKELFNKPQVRQVTTRGDLAQMKKYISVPQPYPPRLVFDAAVWAGEAYGIQKDSASQVIGIGVINPDIYQRNGSEFSEEDVVAMYIGLIGELEKRGYEWQLFTNGLFGEYRFGLRILKMLRKSVRRHLGFHILSARSLVKKISGYRAIIAARMHANIIATSLDIPSVGLVWNDKMNLFAQMFGCEARYISVERMKDTSYIADVMELAIKEGYDRESMDAMKAATMETYCNIVTDNGRNL